MIINGVKRMYLGCIGIKKRATKKRPGWKNGRTGGSTKGGNEHVLPIHSCEDHALCLRSCLTPAETGQLGMSHQE